MSAINESVALLRPLGTYIDIKHGYTFKGEFFRDTPTRNILVTPGNFEVGGGFKFDKPKYYDGPIEREYVLAANDLIVTMTDLSKNGDTLGYPAWVPLVEGLQFLHNQRIGLIRIRDHNELRPAYLYYILCSKSYRDEIRASATGTTVWHTSPERIRAFELILPTPTEQERIASVLEALDYRISTIKALNSSLELLLLTSFKSWFVDFLPVTSQAEGRPLSGIPPATLSLYPASFVDSVLGPIPNGWRVGSIGDVAGNVRNSVTPGSLEPGAPYIALDDMPRRDIALYKWDAAGGILSHKHAFSNGDILFGKLRPYFHKVGIAPIDGVCSTDILVIRPTQDWWNEYVIAHLASVDFIRYVDAHSDGTKMPRTSWTSMSSYAIVLPPERIVQSFSDLFRPIVDNIVVNVQHVRSLLSIRHFLVAQLFGGPLKVKDISRVTELVANA